MCRFDQKQHSRLTYGTHAVKKKKKKIEKLKKFSYSEFAKKSVLRLVSEFFLEKKCLFEQISLSRSKITREIEELEFDILKDVQKKKTKRFFFKGGDKYLMQTDHKLPNRSTNPVIKKRNSTPQRPISIVC